MAEGFPRRFLGLHELGRALRIDEHRKPSVRSDPSLGVELDGVEIVEQVADEGKEPAAASGSRVEARANE